MVAVMNFVVAIVAVAVLFLRGTLSQNGAVVATEECHHGWSNLLWPCAGSGVVRIEPDPFPAQRS